MIKAQKGDLVMTWVDNKNFKHKRETMDYRKQMREEDKQFLKIL